MRQAYAVLTFFLFFLFHAASAAPSAGESDAEQPQGITLLRVRVVDEVGNRVEAAEIRLYKTKEDYKNNENRVGDIHYTNGRGNEIIKNLEPRTYYIQVEKGEKNNFGGGEKVPELQKNRLNKITIVIS